MECSILQKGLTPFRCAVEEERSKVVKYFVEDVKIDTILYDQVIVTLISNIATCFDQADTGHKLCYILPTQKASAITNCYQENTICISKICMCGYITNFEPCA